MGMEQSRLESGVPRWKMICYVSRKSVGTHIDVMPSAVIDFLSDAVSICTVL